MTRTADGAPDAHTGDIHEDDVTAAFSGLFGSGIMDSGVHLVDWRAYEIGTDGHMVGNGPLLHDATADAIHGSGGVIYPPQVALVVSLIAANRGPARFGRMYLPGPALSIGTDRRWTDAQCDTVASTVTTFLKDVSDAIDIPLGTVSASGCNVSSRPGGAGTRQIVDHLEVGRALDTLRSRRNQLLEERHVGGHIDW